LIRYNEDDCRGLKVLKEYLCKVKEHGEKLSEIDYVKSPKDYSTNQSKEIQNNFKLILKSSYHYYENTKISFKDGTEEQKLKKTKPRGLKAGYQGQRKKCPKPTKTIYVEPDQKCYKHPNVSLKVTDKRAKRLVIDLKLTKNGIRKEILKYVGFFSYCKKCGRTYPPKVIRQIPQNSLYGHGIKAYIIYNRIALRSPYQKIGSLLNEQFNESIDWGYSVSYLLHLGNYYQETEAQIIEKLLKSKIIHADETPINIRGETQYAWIFTDGKYAYFKLGKTRESSLAKEFLKGFSGTLITDFYSGYDAIDCPQQKCWVHLIRDVNQDLRKNPFDSEFEGFVFQLKELIIPIMETVQKFGLKVRFLKKHQKQINGFYENAINDKYYRSENAIKYQKRLAKYRQTLFTFMETDGIPWHNNQAERGNRHLAKQITISGFLHESHTPAYLTLLSIMQSCRFQGKSFFKFLFSKEKDLEAFRIKEK
jgi:transposase